MGKREKENWRRLRQTKSQKNFSQIVWKLPWRCMGVTGYRKTDAGDVTDAYLRYLGLIFLSAEVCWIWGKRINCNRITCIYVG